ncbi:procollagen-lysine 5-dioxygenase [Fragilaria crotonensis]|nr:procollagen-lysine 5-dioxygenase [Fragilaria crotonensis]
MPDIGGAINEKTRSWTATKAEIQESTSFSRKSLAHLLHALEGLDRYPNYLNRWNERDMDELELSLQDQLEKVRQQRGTIRARRTAIMNLTESLMPITLQQPTSWEQVRLILDPAFEKPSFSHGNFETSHLHFTMSCQDRIQCS